jgi:hypothetical protein
MSSSLPHCEVVEALERAEDVTIAPNSIPRLQPVLCKKLDANSNFDEFALDKQLTYEEEIH